MDLHIAGDVAVIVGGAKGFGLAIASAFAAEGARVAVVDRDPAVGDVATEFQAAGEVEALGLVADEASPLDVL